MTIQSCKDATRPRAREGQRLRRAGAAGNWCPLSRFMGAPLTGALIHGLTWRSADLGHRCTSEDDRDLNLVEVGEPQGVQGGEFTRPLLPT